MLSRRHVPKGSPLGGVWPRRFNASTGRADMPAGRSNSDGPSTETALAVRALAAEARARAAGPSVLAGLDGGGGPKVGRWLGGTYPPSDFSNFLNWVSVCNTIAYKLFDLRFQVCDSNELTNCVTGLANVRQTKLHLHARPPEPSGG